MEFDALIEVRTRPGISDPEGATIERSLPTLGFDRVRGVRVGKAIRCTIDAPDEASARAQLDELCDRFLTNPVIEDAEVTLAERIRS
jgi:phosphoribosylformylglycinamidine synthase